MTFQEGRERNIALGVWGAVGGFGAAAGVLLGGILTDALSWEWIFRVNVPVGIVAFALAPFLLTESRDAHVKRFDIPGAVLVTAGLSSLVYAITQAGVHGWTRGRTIGFFVASVVMLVGFVVWEARHPEPLMRLGIFRIRTVAGANVAGFILGTAMFSMFLMLTLYMQQVLGYSAMKTGVAYLAVAGTRDRLVGGRRAARDADRREAGAHGRDGVPHGRARVLHAGVGRRLVRDRPAAGLPADRRRDRVRVRADLDRRARGRAAGRGGARVGPDQHVAADRRRARHRGAVDDRDVERRRDQIAAGAAQPQALVDGFTAAFIVGAVIAAAGVVAALTLIRREELAQAPEARAGARPRGLGNRLARGTRTGPPSRLRACKRTPPSSASSAA